MTERLLPFKEVIARVGISRPSIYRKIHSGEFPKQVPLSEGRVAFCESEIDLWIAERIAERDAVA